jgi:hypothetical protein
MDALRDAGEPAREAMRRLESMDTWIAMARVESLADEEAPAKVKRSGTGYLRGYRRRRRRTK